MQDQSNQGQRVVDTGVYGVVRHPFYTGLLAFFVGLVLWLGSYPAAIACGSLAFILVVRIAIEERYLRRNLDGYKSYRTRVRWKILPYIY